MTTKDAALSLIQALPDDVTLEAIQAELEDRLGEEPALTPEEWKAAWLPEWERRLEDMRSGKDPGIPGEEFIQQLREKYG